MNKFFVSALASAGLMAVAAASQATDITYELVVPTALVPTSISPYISPAANYASSAGIPTLNDEFDKSLSPNGPNPFTFGLGALGTSVLSFGSDATVPLNSPGPNDTGSWTQADDPVSFEFYLDTKSSITAGADLFKVTGYLSGTVGYSAGLGFSNASVYYTNIEDVTQGIVDASGTDPNNHVAANYLTVDLDGQTITLYVDTNYSLAQPGAAAINETGFITTTPEPGSVAMIVGMGVSGGIFLRRKRRA